MPSSRLELSLWTWLTQWEGEAAVSQAAQSLQQGDDALRILTGLRRSYGPTKAAAALQQAKLRRRAIEKFHAAERMLFTSRGLAQATGQFIAQYKAARFADFRVVDLCCGIGGDLTAFASRGATLGIDKDFAAAFCAEHNCRATGATDASVLCENVEPTKLDPAAAVHLDPDRRPSDTRTVDLQYVEPSLKAIESILLQCKNVSLKLAPATRLPERWYGDFEIEWIGHRGECKQQVVWTGRLATHPGRRVATVLANDGSIHQQLVQSTPHGGPPKIANLSQYLIEPHPAVLAAHLTTELSEQIQGHRFSSEVAYLTADQPHPSRLASCFEVFDSLPLKRAAVEQSIREKCGTIVEVKTRGLFGVDLKDFSRLKSHGASRFTLVLTRVGGHPRALICQRYET